MVDLIKRPDIWTPILLELNGVSQKIQKVQTVRTSSLSVTTIVRSFVEDYFYTFRPKLRSFNINVENLDTLMQELLRLTSSKSSIFKYKNILKSLKSEIVSLESTSMVTLSENSRKSSVITYSNIETLIIKILKQISPSIALSYEQVLQDLRTKGRSSYRGTASEIREVLRETLDILAPDEVVQKSPGFKFEKDYHDQTKLLSTPTMKQKVRFILKSRGKVSGSLKAPEDAVEIIEQSIASLARSTYVRGSVSTHTEEGIGRPEVSQLKMYVDTVLCELLSIQP